MKSNWQDRTKLIFEHEDKALKALANAHVLICGLGGVGGYAAEQLCRAGIGQLSLVDADQVQPSNRNRQIIALKSTEGLSKTQLFKQRFKDINPDIHLNIYNEFLKDERMLNVLDAEAYDYVVDAIDTLSPKIYLIYHSLQRGYKLVSSMGAGGRLDPQKIEIKDISKSYNCRLAFYLRKHLRKLGIAKGFPVVFSSEEVKPGSIKQVEGETNKLTTTGTISYMPALFGCYCASVVIQSLTGIKNQW